LWFHIGLGTGFQVPHRNDIQLEPVRSYVICQSQSYLTKLKVMILRSARPTAVIQTHEWHGGIDDLYTNNYELTFLYMFVKSCLSVQMPEYPMAICNLHAICCLQVSGVHFTHWNMNYL